MRISGANWTQVVSALASCATLVLLFFGLRGAKSQLTQARAQLDETIRARRIQLILELAKRWNEPLLVASRTEAAAFSTPSALREAMVRFRQDRLSSFYDLALIPDFFEDLGLVVREDPQTLSIVKDLFVGVVTQTWDRWAPTIAWLAQINDQPTLYKNFADLVALMRPTDPRQG